ncbi:phospholipid/cholesterol/gamma-HCH transport system ATP-binding protein [Flavobacterium sp. 103]|uniref:ABC transporter ATP-binding protein n=1 Tax=Flavobacterium sp. 103 TaxID=2135624 RepID=UPI000D5D8576|nr:ATP-binding cassette domain-containing protein [Flavobacterium sp. 103]PVX46445.1 phospholipid/cholesterol/gamma-HCH transport system ATP-binding protein [Flavobacterium sp. 103]
MEKEKIQFANTEDTVIKIEGLYKSFGELEVLKGIDLTIQKGENLAVLGKSGSGKSVLIKILAGLLKPDKGTVTMLGKQLNQLKPKQLDELRLRMGFSFQSSALYDGMSVYDNLAFPLTMNVKNLDKKQVRDAVEEALDAVGLIDKIERDPEELSGGQRKRLGIARTLIMKPEIMLYDEPTAGLDPVTCAEINALIVEVQQKYKTSSIIITHDLTCAKNTCERIAMLIDGTFLKIGTFDEVFATDEEQIKKFFSYNFTL